MIGENYAFGYRPYGTTVDLARYASDDDRRWQGKEYDGEHDKLYFGARFYDPFFGLWMSPDPAGQFANPYSYGGDPLNYIDPTGMWAFGVGLVVGYDKTHGRSLGLGAAAEFGDNGVNASIAFNQDGSKSLGLNANVSVFVNGVWLNGGSGFSMNSYTGASLSRSAGVCFGGSSDACAGFELGQGFSYDRSGGFMGMTAYAEVYATYAGVRTSLGYEQGFFGAEGRGMYAGIGGYGLHAEVSQNGGASWGFQKTFKAVNYIRNEDYKEFTLLGKKMYMAFKMDASFAMRGTSKGATAWDLLEIGYNTAINDGPGVFTIYTHGDSKAIYDNNPITAAELAFIINNFPEKINYDAEQKIKLYACSTGGKRADGGLNFAQELANLTGLEVEAPTTPLWMEGNHTDGFRVGELEGDGEWVTFYPQVK